MFGVPTSGFGDFAAGADAMGRQPFKHLGTRSLNRDFMPDLREQLASLAEAECTTLAEFRCRG